jgi:cobalt-zinc-cadmium efflux system protein
MRTVAMLTYRAAAVFFLSALLLHGISHHICGKRKCMGIHHHHGHHHEHEHDHHHGLDNIAFAFWLNTAFALFEIAGGIYTNSMAILSDALHDLGDSLALGTAWFFERKSHQSRDETYTYGYKRFSLLGAFINSIVLIVGSVFILLEAFKRLWEPPQPDTTGMLILAVIGVAVNGAALLRLRKGTTVNERVISLHFLEDVLGWVAVLFGSIIMKFTHAPVIDPLLSVLISLLILYNVYKNMRGAVRIVLQGVPHNVSEEQVKKLLVSFPEITAVHDLHLWTLDGRHHIVTTHVVLNEPLDFTRQEQLKTRVKQELKKFQVQHATIEFELKDSSCSGH